MATFGCEIFKAKLVDNVFLLWYDIYFKDCETKVIKPENHLAELKIKAEQKRARAAVAKDNKQDEVIVETERILTEANEKMAEDADADMKIATPKNKKSVQIDKTVYEDVFSSSTPVSEIISAVPEEEKTPDEEIDKILNEVSTLESEKSE